jgi:hypothetical protein
VRAAQFRIGQPQRRRGLETNRPVRQTKIGTIVVGTEGQTPRFDRRQLFARIYDCELLFGLIIKKTQLGRAIFRDRGVAIEMIRSEI